jgi:hypothetical protein
MYSTISVSRVYPQQEQATYSYSTVNTEQKRARTDTDVRTACSV